MVLITLNCEPVCNCFIPPRVHNPGKPDDSGMPVQVNRAGFSNPAYYNLCKTNFLIFSAIRSAFFDSFNDGI